MFCKARQCNSIQKGFVSLYEGMLALRSSKLIEGNRNMHLMTKGKLESQNHNKKYETRTLTYQGNRGLWLAPSHSDKVISQSERILTRKIKLCNKISGRGYSASVNTVKENLIQWTSQLDDAGVPEAQLSAEYIIAHVLSVPKRKLHEHAGKKLSEDMLDEIDRLMTCRLARMPVQYIIGEWDFHNITLKMRPPVFIPRPETECLVEKVLDQLKSIHNPKILEIGCGSGAISLALLKSVRNLECVAIDQSIHAVELTKENAENLEVHDRLTILKGKVTMEHFPEMPYDKFDLVVSNPPYVLRKDLMALEPEIMLFEDLRALDGGKDGLDTIKPILLHCQTLLMPDCSIWMEVDPCHQYLLSSWLKTQTDIKVKINNVFQDFAGKDRFIQFTKS